VYLHDQRRHLTMVVSGDGPESSSTGAVGTSLSDDGRRVAVLTGPAAGPVRAEVIDRRTGAVEVVSIGADGVPVAPNGSVTMSGDGRTVMFGSGYTPSLYVRDLRAGATRLLHAGPAYEGALSSDGRYAAYTAGNDVNDIHVEVVRTRTGALVGSVGDAIDPALSADGRYVAFFEGANTLSPIPGEPAAAGQGVYRYDRRTGAVQRVSVTPAGRPANNGSWFPDISADGRTVAFASAATDLVPGDTNDAEDIFARRLR
jgi:TolB protein